jgi:hypothetical protein
MAATKLIKVQPFGDNPSFICNAEPYCGDEAPFGYMSVDGQVRCQRCFEHLQLRQSRVSFSTSGSLSKAETDALEFLIQEQKAQGLSYYICKIDEEPVSRFKALERLLKKGFLGVDTELIADVPLIRESGYVVYSIVFVPKE